MAKINFILDLDQTIISAYKFKKNKKTIYNLIDDRSETKTNSIDIATLDKQDYLILSDYFIIARPGLQDFLNFLFENFEVSVWTAATKNYGIEIIKHFILNNFKTKNRKLKYFFWIEHCAYSTECSKCEDKNNLDVIKNLKYLEKVSFTNENTILLDDGLHHYEYKNNKYNIILVPGFFFTDNDDNFLIKLKNKLQQFKSQNNAQIIVKNIKTE